MVSLPDRIIQAEATVLSFAAEHTMSFTKVPAVINLAQHLARDLKALNSLSMDRTSASYKTRFGVAQTFSDSLTEELKNSFFSLNMDEATTHSYTKVLTVLVSYFSESNEKIVVDHLSSVPVTKADSESIFLHLAKIFDEKELPWTNLISVLMDSCNVMRGVKSGVEVRIREVAPHLIDIDGDTCHHAHNAAKTFCKTFTVHLLFINIFNDFKWSADFREILQELCLIFGVKFTMPERYVPTRWLTIYDVALDVLRLLDVYVIFYFSFLSTEDRDLYSIRRVRILQQKGISKEARARIMEMDAYLMARKMTEDGRARKKKSPIIYFSQAK